MTDEMAKSPYGTKIVVRVCDGYSVKLWDDDPDGSQVYRGGNEMQIDADEAHDLIRASVVESVS